MTFRLSLGISVAGGLLCGLACAVVATGIAGLPSGVDASLVIASCTVGMMVATPLSGFLSDSLGRVSTIRLGTLTLLLASLCVGLSGRFLALLVMGRFFQGAGVGCLFAALPTYVSEIAPKEAKGRSLALFQFFVLFGQVAGAVAGLVLVKCAGGEGWLWRVAFALPALPAVIFFGACGFLRESPAQLRSDRLGLRTLPLLFDPENRKPFALALLTCVLVAATANGPIMNFSVKAMRDAGVAGARANVVDILMQGLCLAATLCASRLVDRIGSRALLAAGAFGAALGLAGLAFALPAHAGVCSAVSLLAFAALFCFGPGVCVFVVMAELLPERVRAVGIAVSLFANHAMSAVAAYAFAESVSAVGYGRICLVFSVVATALAIFSSFCLPKSEKGEQR